MPTGNKLPMMAKKKTPRPRTKPAEVRRDEILRAAASLFIAKGVGPVTIDEITREAGVAKGTFYLYFSSKEDLIAALRERFIDRFCARVRAAVEAPFPGGPLPGSPRPGNWDARLRAWLKAGVDAYLKDYRLHDIVFHDFRPDQRRMKGDNPALADLSALLAAGAKAGAWSVGDPRFVAIVLFQGLHGAVDEAIETGTRNGDELADKLFVLFLKMLRPDN